MDAGLLDVTVGVSRRGRRGRGLHRGRGGLAEERGLVHVHGVGGADV